MQGAGAARALCQGRHPKHRSARAGAGGAHPALAKAVGSPPPEGILHRLKANAEKIVRVRPIKDATGDDPAAVVQRIEARAAERNLAGRALGDRKFPRPRAT